MTGTDMERLPHPAIICSPGPQLTSVIEQLEAGTCPQPEDAVWRDDLPYDLAVRLALATGATMEQIEAGPAEYDDDTAPDRPEPGPEPEESGAAADEADVTLRHTHEDGTLGLGTSKGDGTAEIFKANRWRWFPSIKLWGIPQSRDHLAKRWQIQETAKAMRTAGFKVRVEIDDTPRDVARAKADRAARLDDRYERLSARAVRHAGEAQARHDAADRIAVRFDGGQPILRGHHSERGARADARRIENHDQAARVAAGKAEHALQAASAVGDADAYRERPPVIIRRIARLEAELRQTAHQINGTRPANDWRGAYGPDAKPATGDRLESLTARQTFIEHQLKADREALAAHEANGYLRLTRETVHKGDRVFWGAAWGDGLGGAIVTRTNPKTVTLDRTGWPRTLPYESIKSVQCPHEGTEVKVTMPKRPARRRPAPVTVERPPQRPEPVIVDRSTECFTTPPEIIDRMIAAAGLGPGLDVLEPSAGTGAIALRVAPLVTAVDCIERDARLADRLRTVMPADSGDVRCADFLEVEPNPILRYDRVLMNPPFAGQADIRHVTHALGFLRPGGLLIAVMSAGVRFRQDKAATAFRALVAVQGGRIEPLPDDAFKASGAGVRTVMVVIPAQEESASAGE